jgi:RHS repeat-associated protein
VYDDAGRLETVADGTTPIAEYDYNGNSNRTSHLWSGGTNGATYDAQDRVLTYGDTTSEHSANGELQSATIAGAMTNYTYDGFGKLRTVDIAGTSSIEYVIDAQNRRIGRKLNGTLVQGWIYTDQLRVAAETDGTGAIVSRFVYGTRANAPDYMIRNGATYRILADHLGSPRLVVNTSDGTILQRIDYDEFGNVTSDTNPGFQPFGFAGGLYDHDTRLLRFGARDYDPRTGRWTAKDPILFAGSDTNLYGYVMSDPSMLMGGCRSASTSFTVYLRSSGSGTTESTRAKALRTLTRTTPESFTTSGKVPGVQLRITKSKRSAVVANLTRNGGRTCWTS